MSGLMYKDPIIRKLIDILNTDGHVNLKNRYYEGDPVLIPRNNLPAVFITKVDTDIAEHTNLEDESTMVFNLNLVVDMTQDLNKTQKSVTGEALLYQYMEGRDDTTYDLKTNSMVYVLRKNQQADTDLFISVGTPVRVRYGVNVEKRGKGVVTAEANLIVTVRHHQTRPS